MKATQRIRWILALVLVGLTAAAGARPTPYEAPGPYRVDVRDVRWRDPDRERELPLRIRVPDAPGARSVILFSHGLGGSVEGGRFWGEHWASHGFVVIHLQHPGSDESVWRGTANPGRVLRRAAGPRQFADRIADVKFVLDELQRRKEAGDPLATRIDLARIGMSGHSFGAITTQAIAGETFGAVARTQAVADPRPRAFIAFSPSARSKDDANRFADISRPFFSITGTRDDSAALGLGVAPARRTVPFEGMPPGDKFLLNLTGADHMVFNGNRRRSVGASDPDLDRTHVRVTQATTTAFWLAYLDDDAAAKRWLAGARQFVGSAGEFRAK